MQKLPVILSEILLPFKPKNCFQFGNRKANSIVLYNGRTRKIWFVPSVRLRKGIPMMDSMWHVNNNIYYYSGPLFMYILTTTNTKKPYHLDLADLVCLGSGKGTGIPWFTLLMWGHTKKPRKQKPRKSRLLSSSKGEENRIEL